MCYMLPNRRYACERCENSYTTINNLKRHLRYECGVLPQFKCPLCYKRFVYKFRMTQHIQHDHNKRRNRGQLYPDAQRPFRLHEMQQFLHEAHEPETASEV
ncbi:hypothetical protein GWI33_014873 [Rhynchophorus ferrugineus]|uniref:C2H2-type domain-containing protein n=1 Tax=Rhynchophorus ferrugineus TaxID=354439 RepID=A0A834MBY1_RHYFE|nr:hypothetical protein GWI33_014873 [Rhynchophorus ferrugineus]